MFEYFGIWNYYCGQQVCDKERWILEVILEWSQEEFSRVQELVGVKLSKKDVRCGFFIGLEELKVLGQKCFWSIIC